MVWVEMLNQDKGCSVRRGEHPDQGAEHIEAAGRAPIPDAIRSAGVRIRAPVFGVNRRCRPSERLLRRFWG